MKVFKFNVYIKKINQTCRVLHIDCVNEEVIVIVDEDRANQIVFAFDEVEVKKVDIRNK